MRKLFNSLIASLVLLSACGGSNTESQSEANDVIDQASYPLIKFEKEKMVRLHYDGEFVDGKAWTDNNGENMLIFTSKMQENPSDDYGPSTNAELRVYHYADSGNGYILVREVRDFEKDCVFDNRAVFSKNSVSITDLDQNGYAEVIFVYRLGCTSELSPDSLKLIMLENGIKYAIRGNTLVDYGSEKAGGETSIDPEFDKAPKQFLEHARQIWKKEQEHFQLTKENE
jgi:hypothetical protein